jgi:hypothetical protein
MIIIDDSLNSLVHPLSSSFPHRISSRLVSTNRDIMVRISIPTLPPGPLLPPNELTRLSPTLAAAHLADFLERGRGRTLVITGAGVSVDSGIRAYRGKDGHYVNPNYK